MLRTLAAAACLMVLIGCNKGDEFRLPGSRAKDEPKRVVIKKASREDIVHESKIARSRYDRNPTTRRTPRDDNSLSTPSFGIRSGSMTAVGSATMRASSVEQVVDRLGTEILESMKLRPVVLVWLFDKSNSATSLRQQTVDQAIAMYDKFEKLQKSGNEAFKANGDKSLQTVVVGFGQETQFVLPEPTADIGKIRDAISKLDSDTSGTEKPFTAMNEAVDRFKGLKVGDTTPYLLFVIVTDEAGDDDDKVDTVIHKISSLTAPVYVIGMPAPLGRRAALANADRERPDGNSMTSQVRQGPESLEPEQVALDFWITGFGQQGSDTPVDSGFGPFALTLLCEKSGGKFFAIPENQFKSMAGIDFAKLGKYAPDYISADAYRKMAANNKAIAALIEAAKLPRISMPALNETRFGKGGNEAAAKNQATALQRDAARFEPLVQNLFEILKRGEADRKSITSPRWQAAFDVAYGRAIAAKVRVEGYNQMLASMKQGLKSTKPDSTLWVLKRADSMAGNSALEKQLKQAKEMLERVVKEHEGTPWAAMAQRELTTPMGWAWEEQ